ncbi:MAG: tetratricopeptide repeat protein [Fibrobacteraceae bacterium]|nr:tetratricopeptide repeat protein [Fibrobacteraceae bacterium]
MNLKLSAIALACLFGISLSADPRLEQGARFEAKGDYEAALGEYRSMLADNPQNADAYFAAAEVRVKMKDYVGALANYRLAYRYTPTMSKAYEGAAKVYELLGQKDKAKAELAKDPKNKPVEEVAEPVMTDPATPVEEQKVSEPEEAPVVVEPPKEQLKEQPNELAKEQPKELFKEQAKVAEAEKADANALPSDPFEKGKILLAQGNYKEAAPLWREVLSKKPGDAGAYFYAGVTRYEMGEMDKAEFNLKKGLGYKASAGEGNYYLAMVYAKTNKPELEKKYLEIYLKKSTPDGKFRKAAEDRLAQIKAEKESEKESADTSSSVAETENVDTATVPVVEEVKPQQKLSTGETTIANALALFKAKNYEGALQMYRSLLETELVPEDRYFVTLQMGNIYRELRDFHSAVVRYREVVEQFPDSDWATEAERALEDAVWLEKQASNLPRKKR